MNQIAPYSLEASEKSHRTTSSDKDKADSGTTQVAASCELDNRNPILDDKKLDPLAGKRRMWANIQLDNNGRLLPIWCLLRSSYSRFSPNRKSHHLHFRELICRIC